MELFKNTEGVIENKDELKVTKTNVVMINSNFDTNTCLKQKILKNIINDNYNYESKKVDRDENIPVLSATFNPGKYHARACEILACIGKMRFP